MPISPKALARSTDILAGLSVMSILAAAFWPGAALSAAAAPAAAAAGAGWLGWAVIAGACLVLVIAAGSVAVALRYRGELNRLRDEVRALNTELRQQLAERAAEAGRTQAADRAELLLREVNHRVANSLALVSSLVGLQANMVAEPSARRALIETQSRIYAVGEIHKRLYIARDIGLVEIDEYLADLVAHLDASLGDGPQARATVAIEPMHIPTDKAVSLGVVVTELVTNALKYAYPAGTGGEVVVSLRRMADTEVMLSVRDFGTGYQEGAALRGTGLGTRIVEAMATSLGGRIEHHLRAPGTEVTLVFSVP
ncbi:MAG TPA: sensor histidine kinase [Devosia sp.]|nr:sensor histidine kinase [Devosia sp.]